MILLALLFHLTFHYAIPALIAMLMNNIKRLFHSYVETVNPRTWCHTFFGIQSLCSLGSYPFGNYSINSHLFGGHSIGNYSLVHYWFGDHSFSSFTFGDYNLSDLSFPFRQVQHYLVERNYTPPMINLAPTLNITLETLIALYAGLELSSFPLASCQVLNCLEMWNSSSYLHLKVAESAHLEMGVFSLVYELSEWLAHLDTCSRHHELGSPICRTARGRIWAYHTTLHTIDRLVTTIENTNDSLVPLSLQLQSSLTVAHEIVATASAILVNQTWGYRHKLSRMSSVRVHSLRRDLEHADQRRITLERTKMYVDAQLAPYLFEAHESALEVKGRLIKLSALHMQPLRWMIGYSHWLPEQDGGEGNESSNTAVLVRT
ncbi:hypothetical protein DL93DRAFT_2092324 [Clavulina sp. PMI_390]|nr:hypothetical protein DL93DRAFT_2092324 [Clavulina sp. PMI_390]